MSRRMTADNWPWPSHPIAVVESATMPNAGRATLCATARDFAEAERIAERMRAENRYGPVWVLTGAEALASFPNLSD